MLDNSMRDKKPGNKRENKRKLGSTAGIAQVSCNLLFLNLKQAAAQQLRDDRQASLCRDARKRLWSGSRTKRL
jgi:hypothetical protein